jgi:hypothetical protein
MDGEPMDSQRSGDDIARFGRLFQKFMEQMTYASLATHRSALRDRLDRHLGTDSAALPVISNSFAAYDHVNVQVALSAYLAEKGRRHELVGLTGQQRHFESLSDLIQSGHHAGVQLGAADLVNLPVSPDETLACVQVGLFLVEDRGVPVIALLRGPTEFGQQQTVTLELLSPHQDRATALLAEVRRLMVERNVFRKELVRKAAVLAAQGQVAAPAPGQAPGTGATVAATGAERLTVTDEHLQGALDELLDETGALTRVLLGGPHPGAGVGQRDQEAGGSLDAHPANMALGAGPPPIGDLGIIRSRAMSRSSLAVSRPAVDWLVTQTEGTPTTTPKPSEPPEEPPAGPPSSG